MSSKEKVNNQISVIEKYLNILKKYQGYSKEDIELDVDKRGHVERYLYLVIQATVKMADTIISYKNYRRPSSMRESFEILEGNAEISKDLLVELRKMVGFRNALSHDYEDMNYDIVVDVLKNELSQIGEFVEVIKKKLY